MEDEDMFDDSANPETDALLAKYPELAGKNPSDVYSGLMSRYLGSMESERVAREKAAASQAERFKAARADIEQRRYGAPTTSEQLYALSAALLAPRRMPGIAGSLDRIVPALSQMSQLQSRADAQRAEALAKLEQETAMAREQSLLSGAEGERKAIGDLLRFYGPLAKPKPLQNVGMEVVDGKLVVVRADPDTDQLIKDEIGDAPQNLIPVPGVTAQGQPVFRGPEGIVTAAGQPVTQFDPPKEKPEKPRAPSATELRLLTQTEDLVNNRMSAIRSVQEALDLNQQAYDGSISGVRVALGRLFSSDDPTYVASEQLENLVMTGALANLKATFGANPTEGERKALLNLQANLDKPRAVREKLLRRLLEEMQIGLDANRKRLADLKTGRYGQYEQPSAAPAPTKGAPRVIRYDKNGKRI